MFKLRMALRPFFIALALCSCNDDEANLESELANQYNRLIALSESEPCMTSVDWRFVGIGAKPCGGPSDFIAYSVKIDTVEFLKLVKAYNMDSRTLNEKKGLISDCAIVQAPNTIRCENGKAILIYEQD